MWEKANRVEFSQIRVLPDKKKKTIMGIPIEYVDEGDGPVLFGLPPWPSSSIAYYPLLLAIKHKYRFIGIDLPGWGGGSGSMTLPPTIEAYGAIIRDFIRSFNLEEYSLIGYSFGGVFAQELSSEKIMPPRKQIFVSTIHSGKEIYSQNKSILGIARKAIKAKVPRFVFRKVMEQLLINSRHHANAYFENYWDSFAFKQMIRENLNADPYMVVGALLSLIEYDVLEDYKSCPETLVIYADGDEKFVRIGSKDIANKIGVSPLLLENTNHDHLFFDVNKSADIILNFLLA